ncbi:bifunctional diaminohydroxyphosphoribosylaminopyrimidine deaminase/5-amino-6-(5-phosphoribosylamino)uracil reductase RibD [Bacillus alkalicellulosilyticus]|uniref:bifunctional diaminohydroxyphosphoribosylaminopyrimidine deaminase/5-amino-6-(5-phosphoribosylamino)uracil reductase RibD n=1 Tax=Alkalihalobacterium alkalicellulosilyticum TaxID=1912214 RepID=UPI000996B659|nr:bifunctional diaminohydroxyphosphoribosylaminopyrimidine deaminase/5-amino-6-(5-phosphoribosylamino)uracil reductase RibD [Bacillus alkalicellulosilyticus]
MKDEEYMKLALTIAESAKGQTSPNPLVGCVIVNDGKIVGMGAHLKAGEGHAEVHAVHMAKEKAQGATAYVTLEPCSHHGRTPPCADLLIASNVKRVVIATVDPNPSVAGKGIRKLQDAGIDVEIGVLQDEANELNQVFFHFMKTRKPYVTLKSATSLDGKTATVTGESKWITGAKAREDVHRYRHEHDGILVGIGTVLADNPSLTTRLENGGKNPIRVIVDSLLRIPIESNVVQDNEAPTWIVTSNRADVTKKEALEKAGVSVFVLPTETIEIPSLLTLLGEQQMTSLFVEGGAEINGSFITSKAVNQVITYIAPKLMGGKQAPTAVGGEGFTQMSDVLSLQIQSVEQIGEDIKIISRVKGGD